ncbi:MAG: beta strand repeat-containing protein, partial [Stenotrophomonas sp.]
MTYRKAVTSPAAGRTVAVGEEITYVLTVDVTVKATETPVTLTDVLGDGLAYIGIVSNSGGFQPPAGASPLVFTLPAGTSIGTHAISYKARVEPDAPTVLSNVVTATGGGGQLPTCVGACNTSTLRAEPTVTYSKIQVAPASGTPIAVGDTVTYRLTTNVANAMTTQPTELTDTLGTGLTFAAVTNAGIYEHDPANSSATQIFTLPAETEPGSYDVTYTATVNEYAETAVKNAVTASGDNPTCAGACAITTPVAAPTVSYSKSVALPAGKTSVAVGDVLTYTLTTVIGNSKTTDAVVLSDTLGNGLAFTEVTVPGAYASVTAGNPLEFSLPVNTSPGTYKVSYTATVTATASGTVTNAVSGSGGDTPSCAGSCGTSTPVAAPAVTYSKAVALPAGKTEVSVGDVLTYTLTTVVANSRTTDTVVLSDTLGNGLSFMAVTAAGSYAAATTSSPLTFTLPANTVPGTYQISYTVKVTAAAIGTVTNAVLGSGGDTPSCTVNCGTSTPVAAPAVTYCKSVVLPAGKTEVSVGDVLTYTLTTVVSDAQTTDTVVLTDTLGTGLAFTAVTAPGIYNAATSGNPLSFTLPANTVPGTYAVSYTATVTNAASSGTVTNAVLGSGTDNPSCGSTCTTTTPVAAPAVTYSKSVVLPAGKTSVSVGDVLTYTLTTVVANSKTTDAVVLSDTLGNGLAFTAVTVPGAYAAVTTGSPLVFALPVNTAPGTYKVSYTATVTAAASSTVTNVVLGTGGDTPSCAASCGTSTPVAAPAVTYSKSVVLPAGKTDVSVGDVLTYTLTTVVTNSKTTDAVFLSDTLGNGLAFTEVTVPGVYAAVTTGNPLAFTLPVNTAPGTYKVSYTATVTGAATGTVTNAVVGSGGDTPTCSGSCGTSTPVVVAAVRYSKSVVSPASGTQVKVGDQITYRLTTTVSGARTTADVVLSDALGNGLQFQSVTLAGGYTHASAGGLEVFTLPAGQEPNTDGSAKTYAMEYTAVVTAAATTAVDNSVTGSGGGGSPPTCVGSCTTTTPLGAAAVTYAKSVVAPAAGTEVKVGDEITYRLVATISDAQTTADLVLTDTLGTGLRFTAVTVAGDYVHSTAGGKEVFTLPAGKQPNADGSGRTYAVEYTAAVTAAATTSVQNNVVGGGGATPPICAGSCATTTPVVVPAVAYSKSVVLPAGKTEVSVGDVLTYTLT